MPSKATCCPKHFSGTHILPLRLMQRKTEAPEAGMQWSETSSDTWQQKTALLPLPWQGKKAIALPKSLAQEATAASVNTAVRAYSQTKAAGISSLLLVLYPFGQGWFPQSSSSPGLGTGSPWAACEQKMHSHSPCPSMASVKTPPCSVGRDCQDIHYECSILI